MIPVNPTPKSQRTVADMQAELTARLAEPMCLANRIQIGLLRTAIDERRCAAAVAVVMEVETHEVERGLWCHDCALPSIVRHAVVLTDNPTVRLSEVAICHDCGAHS